MNFKELEYSLNKINKAIDGKDIWFSPFNLVETMVNSVDLTNKKILVNENPEFLCVLKNNGINLDNITFNSKHELRNNIASVMGIKKFIVEDNYDIIFEIDLSTQWKLPVENNYKLLSKNGKYVCIIPSNWRTGSSKGLFTYYKNHISKLYILGTDAFKNVIEDNIRGLEKYIGHKYCHLTDILVFNENENESIEINYLNGDKETFNTDEITEILPFSTYSIPYSILNKINGDKDYHNGIIDLSKAETNVDIIYFYLGGFKNTQYRKTTIDDKKANVNKKCWITNNTKLLILLNSKIFKKICLELIEYDRNHKVFLIGYIRKLNIENFNCNNEEEIYEHFNITQKEIDWINA